MPGGPKTTRQLIDAVRQCSVDKLSFASTAAKLSTQHHPLTPSAIAGIAHRNGIKFSAKRAPGSKIKREKTEKRAAQPAQKHNGGIRTTVSKFTTVVTARPGTKQPGSICSWHECTDEAEPGDMFCHKHYRRGLL